MKPYKIILQEKGDDNGLLTIAEKGKEIPFETKRIFYIYNTKQGVVRGKHANINSEFFIINIQGSCKIKVTDGDHEEYFYLDKQNQAVYIPKMLWKEMYDFSPNSILLVLSNEIYDPNEYLRDYDEYCKKMREERNENINYSSCLF